MNPFQLMTIYIMLNMKEILKQNLCEIFIIYLLKKHLLILRLPPGDILIDYAVGKGGDLSIWKHSKLKFILTEDGDI